MGDRSRGSSMRTSRGFQWKSAKIEKNGIIHPKTTIVVMYKCLGYPCEVVLRAKHNPRVLEQAFANRSVAVRVENRRKSSNFGHFGPCRTHD